MSYRLTSGWPQRISDGAFVNPETNQEYLDWIALGNTPEPIENNETIAEMRLRLQKRIDDIAGEVRSKYITIAPGQEATYISKETECRKFKADSYPEANLDQYVWVKAEKEATEAVTGQVAADAIILQADQWKMLGSAIEKVRRAGKLDLDKRIAKTTLQASFDATETALRAL